MDMTSEAAPTGGGERAPVVVHTAAGDGNLSLRDAANAVRTWRRKGSPPERAGAPPSADASRTQGATHRDASGLAASDRNDRGEGADAISLRDLRERSPDDLKSDRRPRQAAQEIPAQTQREPLQETRHDTRNDAAMQHAAIAHEDALRQQAERALPLYVHTLERTLANEFADIRSQADAARLAQTQPQRFARLQALSTQLTGVSHQADALQQRHHMQRSVDHYAARESERLKAHIPEVDDEAQWGRLKSSAVSMLKTLNYSDADLAGLWRGDKAISIHDHRFQRLLRDAVRWQELQSGEAAVLPDSAHAPRVVHIRSPESRARLRDLGETLESSRGVNALQAAANLLAERRKAARFR